MNEYGINLDLTTISASAVAIVPIIIAIVQGLKMAWSSAEKFAPLVSLAVGILISLIADHETGDWTNSLLSGVIYGLSASGLYSGVKATAHASKENKKDIV